ncbi:CSC1-like protein [Cinnamomum micranthum f. kanehirae]|uniref:CSC1-like protein n=1 Tax=Cinnamomum micranthum f. kanehirae TaxID=337451 RepID=A0A3S3NMK6_9MAGN|nr:CSC1-like protein [Cinnamomum micranthum f. kanehirae]
MEYQFTSSFPASSFSSSPPPAPVDPDDVAAWYGNIQYLLNISAIGASSCVLLFLLVKLRSDHRRIPGPAALLSKLLAVWHAAIPEIGRHCGADAAQFLLLEGGSSAVLLALSLPALLIILPVNLFAGTRSISDQFSITTIVHIPRGSLLLWLHLLFSALVVFAAHLGITSLERRLRSTRFRDACGNPSDTLANSVALFTIMLQGIPKSLATDRAPLEEYFNHRYPGKVYRIVAPFDLCSLDDLVARLVKVRTEISWLEARISSRIFSNVSSSSSSIEEEEEEEEGVPAKGFRKRVLELWSRAKEVWTRISSQLRFTEEDRFRKLRELEDRLESELKLYREGRARGAGIAFVMFKDIYTTNKAVQDFRMEKKKRPIGRFFSVMELQLERNKWKVERAPPAADIYWNHLGSTKLSLKLRRVAVNTCLVLMLLFCSSPLAVITAVKSAARIINAEAMDNAQLWFAWLESSSWAAALILQFLPNVLLFVSMYIVVPAVLSTLSKFERHLTVSGEQRAALLKMVCFFLVNLILLRALVESSLESAILRMGRCYLDGEDCKRIEQYMSGSFLSRSCLSSLAFLITSTFLGISYDLLAPIPWIKNKLQKFRKNDMLLMVPEQSEDYPLENQEEDTLQRPLMPERDSVNGDSNGISRGIDLQGQDLSVYPISRSIHVPKQTFDFAQYYAFNLTIFALTLIYSAFSPLVVPVGAIYFGYRYVVDKYNFLFVYRVRGFPACNDGKLMDSVLCIMRFCVVLFLLSMLLYFSVQGDSMKLQAITTLGLLLLYKLLPSQTDGFQPSLLESMQTVDNIVDGPTDYELGSKIYSELKDSRIYVVVHE